MLADKQIYRHAQKLNQLKQKINNKTQDIARVYIL